MIDCPICAHVYSEKRTHCPVCGCSFAGPYNAGEIDWTTNKLLVVAHGAERARQCPQRPRFLNPLSDESA